MISVTSCEAGLRILAMSRTDSSLSVACAELGRRLEASGSKVLTDEPV